MFKLKSIDQTQSSNPNTKLSKYDSVLRLAKTRRWTSITINRTPSRICELIPNPTLPTVSNYKSPSSICRLFFQTRRISEHIHLKIVETRLNFEKFLKMEENFMSRKSYYFEQLFIWFTYQYLNLSILKHYDTSKFSAFKHKIYISNLPFLFT